MTWMWKWGTSWKATSPSMTSRLAPAAPSVCRARAAICRATLKARIAAVSSTSCMSTACARGTTSMWPWVIGWMSMKATTLSSWWVKLAGASPLTIAQKMQSSLKLACPAPEVRRRLGRGRGVGTVRVERCVDISTRFNAHRRLSIAARFQRDPLPTAPPARAPVAAIGSGQPLHLRADADALARGDHGADPCDQPVLFAVLEQRPEQLGRSTDHGLRVADDDQQLLGARDGHIDSVGVVEEADGRAVVRADERKDDSVRLAAFERVDRLDVVRRHDALERSLQPVDLRVVHRDHGQVRLADAPADDRGDVFAKRNLELVGDRTLRIAVLVLRTRVDPYELAVERPRQWHSRMWRLVDELALVKEVGHDAADRLAHAVLARQHDLRRGRHFVPHPAVEAVVAHELVERLLDLEGGSGLFHHGRQLLEVADHHPALRYRHQRQRLVGPHLVGLVEDQPVERLEPQAGVDGETVAGAGDEVVRLEVVALDQRGPQPPGHLPWLGDARLPHVRKAQQAFLAGVDGVVGV